MSKRILLLGIGQFGADVAETYARSMHSENENVFTLAVDTDPRIENECKCTPYISLSHPCKLSDVLDNIDTTVLKEYFPCDRANDYVEYIESLYMNDSSNGWRMKALLSLTYFLSQEKQKERLEEELQKLIEGSDSASEFEIYTAASLAGGTGSGLLVPLTLYIKNYIERQTGKHPQATALLAMTDICEELLTGEQLIKARANAYATLREINAMNLTALKTADNINFKIGSDDNPYLGKIYSSDDADNEMPFKKVFLFRRAPGVHSVIYHVGLVADSFKTLCTLPDFTEGTISDDAVFGGISMTKTVYPARSIISYIANALIYDCANDSELNLFHSVSKEISAKKQLARAKNSQYDDNNGSLAHIINDISLEMYGKSSENDPVMNRKGESPCELSCPEYIESFESTVIELLNCEGAYNIENLIKENKKLSNENAPAKKEKASAVKAELTKLGKSCKAWLTEYYFRSKELVLNASAEDLLPPELTNELLCQNVLESSGQKLSISYALARLSSTYAAIENSLKDQRALTKKEAKTEELLSQIPEGEIPEELLMADPTFRMKCKYDKAGAERFAKLLSGRSSHIGGSAEDRKMFCYDLENIYASMKGSFRAYYAEALLVRLGELIRRYYNALEALDKGMAELKADKDIALNKYTESLGARYNIGVTAYEKESFYSQFKKELTRPDGRFALDRALDAKFFENVISKLALIDEPSDNDGYDVLAQLVKEFEASPECESFYTRVLGKNIMEILLGRDGKNGTESLSFALSKAFCPGSEPLTYQLPDSERAYELSSKIIRTVSAIVPECTKEYLNGCAPEFNCTSADKLMQTLLCSAGEFSATVSYSNSLPKGELRMIRMTEKLKLGLIECFSEDSEEPICYKAYLKALDMQKQQCTDLWNPHLVTGDLPSTLPMISDSYLPPKDDKSCPEEDFYGCDDLEQSLDTDNQDN